MSDVENKSTATASAAATGDVATSDAKRARTDDEQQEPDANTMLFLACESGDVEALRRAIDERGAQANFQDEDSGVSALMVAAVLGQKTIVEELLRLGAPWNAVDRRGRCAGEYAIDGGHQEVIDVLVDAGVRAELLLGLVEDKLIEREGCFKDDDQTTAEGQESAPGQATPAAAAADEGAGETRQQPSEAAADGIDASRDHLAGASSATNSEYLANPIACSEGKIVDANKDAVMMDWEAPLMLAHAKVLAPKPGKHVLNVGFGMGIVDTYLQAQEPASHTIIEAHPDVLKRMEDAGWMSKPNVRVVRGRWQDVIGELTTYDGIFFDTYGEYYRDLKNFHSHLPKLLRSGGVYSYFNGLCPRNVFFHAVYCQIVQLELAQLGLATEFRSVPVDSNRPGEWDGVRRKYWWHDLYYLPIAQWSDASGKAAATDDTAQ